MKLIDTTFERIKIYFNELGFINSLHCPSSYSFDFCRVDGNVEYEIGLSYIKEGKDIRMNGRINSSIICLAVVNILEQFIKLNCYDRITVIKFPNYNENFENPLLRAINSQPVNSEEDFLKVKNIIFQHINTYILPFFDRVPSLQAVNDEILNKVSDKEYSNFIPGQTNFKVLIIMKLCENPKYEGFKKWALEAYKKGTEIDPDQYGPDYRTLQSLVSYLDSGQYKKDQA